MEIDIQNLKRQSLTLNITQLAKIYDMSYGKMYSILQRIGYTPKKRGRKGTVILL